MSIAPHNADGASTGMNHTMNTPAGKVVGKRIILVEDDPRARAALSYLLLQTGHNLLSCLDAEQALDTLADKNADCQPDVAILDLRLPGMRGDQFGALLRKQRPNTQIIFVTADHNTELAVADAPVLRKPLNVSQLLQMIQ